MLVMDWKQLISDITSLGLSQADISTKTGIAPSAISELATGKTKEPRWSTGQKLRSLYRATKRRPSKQEA